MASGQGPTPQPPPGDCVETEGPSDARRGFASVTGWGAEPSLTVPTPSPQPLPSLPVLRAAGMATQGKAPNAAGVHSRFTRTAAEF